MDVDGMTLGELRVAIAERVYARHDWQQTPALEHTVYCARCGMTAGKVDPDVWGPYCNLDGPSPDWPTDIAAADSLLDGLDGRGTHYELASLAGTGYQLTIVMDGPDGEIWLIYGIGPTRSEAICRAWLKATEPAE